MDKPLLQQKIQRAIDRRRLGLRFGDAQQIEQVISADCTGLLSHQTQHFQPLRRQSHIALLAEAFRLRQQLFLVVEFIANIPVRKSRFYHDYGESPRVAPFP